MSVDPSKKYGDEGYAPDPIKTTPSGKSVAELRPDSPEATTTYDGSTTLGS